jgi:putative ABC transport system permease protein
VGTSDTFVTGVDPSTISRVANIEMTSGSIAALARPDSVVISRTEASGKGFAVGDTIEMRFARTGTLRMEVVGTFEPNGVLNDYAVSLDTFDANVAQQLDQMVFIDVAPGSTVAQGKAAIAPILERDYPSVQVSDQEQFRRQQLAAVDQVFAFVYGLLFLSVLISMFGIINTLGLSIHERIRELGLLRAVGMSRRQVRRMVRVEAVIIAILGAFLGLVIGILFGWAMQRALADLGIDRFAVPTVQLVFMVIVAAMLGVVAAIIPARRAARLNMLEAIAYE